MPIAPELPFPKDPGDSIRSKDWNEVVVEVQRLDSDKLDRASDTVTGTLTVAGALGVGTGGAVPAAKLQVAGGALMPATGNSEQSGILFPTNPGSGLGDAAWIRHYVRAGESTTLEIGTSNDADDHIALMPSGNVGIGTVAPNAKLEVDGDAIIQSGLVVNGLILTTGPVFSNGLLQTVTNAIPDNLNIGAPVSDLSGLNMTVSLPVAHRVRISLRLEQLILTDPFVGASVIFQFLIGTATVVSIGTFSAIGSPHFNLLMNTDIELPAGATTVRARWVVQNAISVASASTAGDRTLSVTVI